MKYLFIFVLMLNMLYGNDGQFNKYCFNDNGFSVNYQNQLNSLEDKINDTNLNNKLLEQKLNDTEKYYSSILRNQELIAENEVNQLKSILEQQEKNHQDTISNLFYLFNMIVATFIFLGAGITFFGKNYLIKKIKKEISSNHVQVTTKLVSELGEKKEFIEIIKAQIYIEKDSFKDEDEDEDENISKKRYNNDSDNSDDVLS